jgi:hypothetical protein
VSAAVLDLQDNLSPRNLEQALLRERPYAGDSWATSVRDGGLVFDLRRVGWVEPTAAARVVLLAEACFLAGHEVTVKLPRFLPTEEEASAITSGGSEPSTQTATQVSSVTRLITTSRSRISARSAAMPQTAYVDCLLDCQRTLL